MIIILGTKQSTLQWEIQLTYIRYLYIYQPEMSVLSKRMQKPK